MDINFKRTTEEIMWEQAVELREIIPENVKGIDTFSMACCPTEVFYFAKLYIEELQEKIKLLEENR